MHVYAVASHAYRPAKRRPGKKARRANFFRLLLITVLALAAHLFAPRAMQVIGRAEAPATVTHTVLPSDSLWAIATRYNPGVDPRKVVHAIKQANQLGTVTVHPGQLLTIPILSN